MDAKLPPRTATRGPQMKKISDYRKRFLPASKKSFDQR